MGLGITPDTITAMLQQMAAMSPPELEELMADQAQDVGDLSDGHLITYLDECYRESFQSDEERRNKDDILWQAHEGNMIEMADKEDWQSKITLNTPFTTVLQAKSLVRKGLMERPDYFGLDPTDPENQHYKARADFWEKVLKFWTSKPASYLPHAFADAAEMGFAVGQSMAVKVLLTPDENGVQQLRLPLLEPWKTYPDPDRQPRLPWSGLYNIHEEWVDFYQLRQGEQEGYYQNIDQVTIGKSQKDASGYSVEDKELERRRKGQTLHRNKFRKAILVKEFWGTILDEQGDILMPSATYTVANGVVIRKVRPSPFKRARWPWVDFAPLPHVLRFHGYGLFEGVMAIWKFQNALLNLYIDNENWRINNMFEVDPNNLDDPSDLEIYPLKVWLLKSLAEGKPAVRAILKGDSALQDVQFMWGLVTNLWENGSFVTELLKGEQGGRKDITATEIQLKLQQSIGVFDSIGKDVERGGVDLLALIKEVLTTFWTEYDQPTVQDVLGNDPYFVELLQQGDLSWTARQQALACDCDIQIRGVSRLFNQADEIERLKQIAQLGMQPQFAQFVKPFTILTKIADNLNVSETVRTEQEVMQQQQAEQQQQQQGAIAKAISDSLAAGTAAHEKQHGHAGKGGALPELGSPAAGPGAAPPGGTPDSAGAPPAQGPPPPASAIAGPPAGM